MKWKCTRCEVGATHGVVVLGHRAAALATPVALCCSHVGVFKLAFADFKLVDIFKENDDVDHGWCHDCDRRVSLDYDGKVRCPNCGREGEGNLQSVAQITPRTKNPAKNNEFPAVDESDLPTGGHNADHGSEELGTVNNAEIHEQEESSTSKLPRKKI